MAPVVVVKANCHQQLLLILDIQVGLYHIARDWDPSLYQNNIMAHAALGQVFDIPVILSTSADTGPNGVRNLAPQMKWIRRTN
jgi:hypothetical protein